MYKLEDHFSGCAVSSTKQHGRTRLVDQHKFTSVVRTFAATQPMHAIAELCCPMSRQPFQIPSLPRVSVSVCSPVGHANFPYRPHIFVTKMRLYEHLAAGFTFPITAWPPSFTCTCSTLTNCEPPFLSRRRASTWSAYARNSRAAADALAVMLRVGP